MLRTSESPYQGILYIISSPIGNLKDITFRALDILKSVDYLYCEDTRVTSKLLKEYGIERTLNSYHDFSGEEKENYIIETLKEGKSVGLISDAGTPLISDPGFEIVRHAKKEGIKVSPIPGCSAQVAALTMSGFDVKPYMFYGFLDHKDKKKEKELEALKNYDFTIIFYESPLRLKETIEIMYKVFGDRRVSISREITKMYEETLDLSLSEYESIPDDLKGEMVIVLEGKKKTTEEIDIILEMEKMIESGSKAKDAAKVLSTMTGLKASDIYSMYLKEKK